MSIEFINSYFFIMPKVEIHLYFKLTEQNKSFLTSLEQTLSRGASKQGIKNHLKEFTRYVMHA